jgi:uncharacterized damage-inducible protein DinB
MTYYGGKDLARSFRTVRKNTLVTAEEIPEEQYDFRPAPGSRTVREILAHVLTSSQGTYRGHAVRKITTFVGVDLQAVIEERLAQERQWSVASKSQLLDALRSDGEAWEKHLEQLSEDDLAVTVTFPGPAQPPSKSRFEILLGNKEHEMHHRAQLMVIERMLGLVPHLTRERQARMAGFGTAQEPRS